MRYRVEDRVRRLYSKSISRFLNGDIPLEEGQLVILPEVYLANEDIA